MTTRSLDIPLARYARIAGALYLVIAVFGTFAIAYVPSVILVQGDAAATVTNLLAHQGLFGMGVFADVVVMLTEIVLSVMLFILFRPISPTLSLVAMIARLSMVLVMAVNLLIHIAPMLLLRNLGELESFGPEQVHEAALFLMQVHGFGIYVWDMFFGFHLLALGYLIARSGYFPSLLGIAVMVGSFGYFLEGLRHVAFIDNAALGMAVVGLLIIATLSELAFAFWLLLKGLDTEVWHARSAQPARA